MLGTEKNRKIEKFHTNAFLNFFLAVGCAEIFFQGKNCKNSKKNCTQVFEFFLTFLTENVRISTEMG